MSDRERACEGDGVESIVVVQDPDGMVTSMAGIPDGTAEQASRRKAQRVAYLRSLAGESFRRSQQRSQQRFERSYILHSWMFIVFMALDTAYVAVISAFSFANGDGSALGDSGLVNFFIPIYSIRKAVFDLIGTIVINSCGMYGAHTRSRGFLTFLMYANIAMVVLLLLEGFSLEPFLKIMLVLYAFYIRCLMIMLEDNVYNFSWNMLSPGVEHLLRRLTAVEIPPFIRVFVPAREAVVADSAASTIGPSCRGLGDSSTSLRGKTKANADIENHDQESEGYGGNSINPTVEDSTVVKVNIASIGMDGSSGESSGTREGHEQEGGLMPSNIGITLSLEKQ